MTVHKCKWCGKQYKRRQRNTQYCCKKCRQDATREKTRNRVRKHRKKYPQKQVGTRNIGPHKQENNEKEANIIRKEKKKLLIK